VRRLVVIFSLSLVAAGLFGYFATPSLSVNGSTVSAQSINGELAAISQHPVLQCFITALDPVNFGPGAGSATTATSGTAAWSTLRTEGLAIDSYVEGKLHFHPNAQEIADATLALEEQLSQAAKSANYACPGSPAEALSLMPLGMRTFELTSEADSLYLVGRLNSTIPLTSTALHSYYLSHSSAYDTLCISIALVPPTLVNQFANAQAAGQSVAHLATTYSVDASGAKGGAYGCYGPTSSAYTKIRSLVSGLALNTFPTSPASTTYNNSTYALYVAVTKRTTTPYATAAATVLGDVQKLNTSSAGTITSTLMYNAVVAIDPSLGRWGLGSSGPQVFAPAVPGQLNATLKQLLTTASTTPYH
jgi:hypothetical protein